MTQKASYWDSVAKKWQEASPNSLWRAYNDAVNATWLEQCLPNGKVNHLLKTDLFDESLDNGLYPLLKSKANKVAGVDISTLTSHAAKSRHTGLEVIAADVRQLPFADGVFDIIVSNSTLDHFESSDEILSSLRELHRVLQPGGQLLITLDNLLNPVIALRAMLPFRLLNRLNIVPYYVGATFSPRRLCNYLELIGFNVTKVNAIMHFPRVLTMAIALILQKQSGGRLQRHLLNFLMIFERLEYLPTKFLTGYFVAVRAIKR